MTLPLGWTISLPLGPASEKGTPTYNPGPAPGMVEQILMAEQNRQFKS